MDGFQLLRELRRDAATRTIPIVLLSARAGEESRVEGLEAGADDYLVKPFSARELIARVGVHLELSRVRRELVAARDRLLSDVAAERTRLYELFMQAPAVIAYLRGPEHVFEFTNPRYQQLFGHRELVGKPIREALPELDGQGFFELLDQVFTSGEPYIGDDVRARLDTGGGKLEDRYFDFVYQPLRRADGAVEGVLVHAVDVTERVRTRQEKEQFLSAVSHDLKNPLTAIKGMGQLLRRRVARLPEAEQQSFIGLVQEIDRTCDRLTGLLDQLLDLTRPQWGQSLVLDRRPTDLVELAQRLTRRHQESTERHELVLQTPQAPVVGDWDTDRLERVVGNLLSNALKYSPDGGPVLIEVAVEDTGDRRRAVLTVRDHGVGIPAADLPHVFERFYRGSNVTGLIGGTGIGLAGVKQIVEQHDGSIAIESLEGAGTTVSVRLPLA
jgi:PAS domain S-box-containing protein